MVELVEFLDAAGHEVSVVTTFIDNFRKEVPESYRGKVYLAEDFDACRIHRVWAYSGYKGSMRRRYLNFATFMCSSTIGSLLAGKPDVVIATSPPLTVALAGLVVSVLRGVPFVFEVRDLWPDAAVELGVLRDPRMVEAARAVERFLYRRATKIVTISPGLGRYLTAVKQVCESKIEVITQGVDLGLFGDTNGREFRSRLGLRDKFVVFYLGALGINNAMEIFVEAARELASDPRFAFVTMGDGDELDRLRAYRDEHDLRNLHFLEPVPKLEIGRYLAGSDLCFLSLRPFYSDCALPNKVFDYLAAGKPMVVVGGGTDVRSLLERSRSGAVTPPGDLEALIACLREYAADPERVRSEGAAAREFAELNLGWSRVLRPYDRLLTELSRNKT